MDTCTRYETSRPVAGQSDGQLARVVQSLPKGDPQREAACEMLVSRYQQLVGSCVQRYRDSPEPADDLMQVGYVGLLKAISNFDDAVSDTLAAYAQVSVSGEIKRYFRDKRWQVRVRRAIQELRLEIRRVSPELTQQLSRAPRASELACYLRVSEEDVLEAQCADGAFRVSSLDASLGADDDASSLGDLMGEDDPQIQRLIDVESLWAHWDELPYREQRMLLMRYYGNMTQKQIGDQLGLSQMHVSRLLAHALDYLRQQITESGRSHDARLDPPDIAASA